MMLAATEAHAGSRRPWYGLLLLALAAPTVALGWHTWQLWVFLVAPDLALLAGMGRGLAKGQIRPGAVPFYNAAHSFWSVLAGAAVLALLLTFGRLDHGSLVAWSVAIGAWGAHIAADRALGFGQRTPDGFQRGR